MDQVLERAEDLAQRDPTRIDGRLHCEEVQSRDPVSYRTQRLKKDWVDLLVREVALFHVWKSVEDGDRLWDAQTMNTTAEGRQVETLEIGAVLPDKTDNERGIVETVGRLTIEKGCRLSRSHQMFASRKDQFRKKRAHFKNGPQSWQSDGHVVQTALSESGHCFLHAGLFMMENSVWDVIATS